MGSTSSITRFIRGSIGLVISLWATTVFYGMMVGSFLLFLRHFFEPILLQKLNGIANLNIPDWLFFLFGISLVVIGSVTKGKPLLRDANREQFKAIEYAMRTLPEEEQRQNYRKITRKMIDQFELDSTSSIDLMREAKEAVKQEKA